MTFSEAGRIPSVEAHSDAPVLPSNTEQAETSVSPEIGDLWESRDGLHLFRVASVSVEDNTVTLEYRTKNAQGGDDPKGGTILFVSPEDLLKEYQLEKKVQDKPSATVVQLSDYLLPQADQKSATEQGRYEADIETTRAALFKSIRAILASIEQSTLKRKEKRIIQQKASVLLDLATPKDGETDASVETLRTALREADELLEVIKSSQIPQQSQESVAGGSVAGASLDALIQAQAIARPATIDEPTPEVVASTSADGSMAPPREGAGEPAKVGEEESDKVKEGGPGGPEGPEGPEFGLVIAELKTKVEGIINAITTPKEYGEFRAKMVKRKSRGGHVRHLFFHIDDIKEKVGRKITDDELDQVKAAEDWLESVIHRKFGVIKKDGLKVQFETEVARITSVQDDSGLEALAQAWSNGISPDAWQSEWKNLTEWDQKNITNEYEALMPELLNQLKARRREIRFEPWMDRLGAGALEKLVLLEDAIRNGYQVYRRQIHKAVGGRISNKERQELWDQKGGERILEDAIVQYLQQYSAMNPDEGRKLFRVIIGELRQD